MSERIAMNTMFLSPYTAAILEDKRRIMQQKMAQCEGGELGRGYSIEIREISGFPDGVVVYSDGTVTHPSMPEEGKQ